MNENHLFMIRIRSLTLSRLKLDKLVFQMICVELAKMCYKVTWKFNTFTSKCIKVHNKRESRGSVWQQSYRRRNVTAIVPKVEILKHPNTLWFPFAHHTGE